MGHFSIEKAKQDKIHLAREYEVPITSIIWIGDNHYIIVQDGKEIKI